jgi:hypothetical protein
VFYRALSCSPEGFVDFSEREPVKEADVFPVFQSAWFKLFSLPMDKNKVAEILVEIGINPRLFRRGADAGKLV